MAINSGDWIMMIPEKELDEMIDETNDSLHKLMDWGFNLTYVELFVKDNPSEVLITKQGNPGMKLLRFYLERCSKLEMGLFSTNHFSKEQIDIVKGFESKEIIGKHPTNDKETKTIAKTIAMYIEELAKARKMIEDQSIILLEQKQIISQLQQENEELRVLKPKIQDNTMRDQLRFLYNLMSEDMEFKEGAKINKEDIQIIEEIKEVIEK